jgi:Ca-activated chloride channel family protein
MIFLKVYPSITEFSTLPNFKWYYLKIFLLFCTLLFLLISISNPSFEKKELTEEVQLQGVDILFIVDVSFSMNAVDVSPSRIEKFKESILKVLPDLQGNRFGVITFANTAFLYCPMTSDISAFSDYIKGIDVDMIPNAGTNISVAFAKAKKILSSEKIKRNRIVVIVTDGEDLKSGVGESLDAEVLVWGIGTEEGGPIFYKSPYSTQSGYVSKSKGELVEDKNDPTLIITKLDKENLFKIAKSNKGEYFNLTVNPSASESIIAKVQAIQKNESNELNKYLKKDGYHYFLAITVFLLLLDLMVIDRYLFKKKIL